MFWDKRKLANHIKAADQLDKIKNNAFEFIKENSNITEYGVQKYILLQLKNKGLKTDRGRCIVAFRKNTQYIHYYPSQHCLKLTPGSLIMIDIWARLNRPNSPYADITWMGYFGKKVPVEVQSVFGLVIKARNIAFNFLKNSLRQGRLPTGREVDEAARSIIREAGHEKNFRHGTGHSLGMNQPHGPYGRINTKNNKPLLKNMGYTIEPGVYLKNKFGIRSEIDVFIDNRLNLIVTSKRQRSLIML